MNDKTCANCRFFVHIQDAIDEKVYSDVPVGMLWWKRTERRLMQQRFAANLDECWRYPRGVETFSERWCGEWKPRQETTEAKP